MSKIIFKNVYIDRKNIKMIHYIAFSFISITYEIPPFSGLGKQKQIPPFSGLGKNKNKSRLIMLGSKQIEQREKKNENWLGIGHSTKPR
jgi:hypothetical protein